MVAKEDIREVSFKNNGHKRIVQIGKELLAPTAVTRI